MILLKPSTITCVCFSIIILLSGSIPAFSENKDFSINQIQENCDGPLLEEKYIPKITSRQYPNIPSQYSQIRIYADVDDKYGEIIDARLFYSVIRNNSEQSIVESPLKLVSGIPSNGIFLGTIQSNSFESGDDLHYLMVFNDDLGYCFSKSDIISLKFFKFEPVIQSQIYPVDPRIDEEIIVYATIQDRNQLIHEVFVSRCQDGTENCDDEYKIKSELELESVKNGDEFIFKNTLFNFRPFMDNQIFYSIIVVDQFQNQYSEKFKKILIKNESEKAFHQFKLKIIDINSKDLTADGELEISSTCACTDFADGKELMFLENLDSDQIIRTSILLHDDPDISTKYQFTNKPVTDTKFYLSGDPTNYPFDSYDLIFLLDSSIRRDNHVLQETSLSLDEQVFSSWSIQSGIYNTTQIIHPERGLSNAYVIPIERNFATSAIQYPLLLIFFLLGATLLIGKLGNDDVLANRLAITLSIFAFVFAFSPIIDELKPFTQGAPTLAELLLLVLIISTIVFSIGTIMTRYFGVKADILKLVLCSIIVIVVFIGTPVLGFSTFPIEITSWLVPLLILSFSYGLIIRIFKKEIDLTSHS